MESGEGESERWRVRARCDQNVRRSQWHLGGMVEFFPRQDGQVRVFQVNTRGKKFIHSMTPVERRWSARVRDIKRRSGQAINLNLLVVL